MLAYILTYILADEESPQRLIPWYWMTSGNLQLVIFRDYQLDVFIRGDDLNFATARIE